MGLHAIDALGWIKRKIGLWGRERRYIRLVGCRLVGRWFQSILRAQGVMIRRCGLYRLQISILLRVLVTVICYTRDIGGGGPLACAYFPQVVPVMEES